MLQGLQLFSPPIYTRKNLENQYSMTEEELAQNNKSLFVRIKRKKTVLKELLDNSQRIAIYYESSYNKAANDFIRREYNTLLTVFNDCGIAFVYIPILLEDIDESLKFNFPDSITHITDKFKAEDFYKTIADSIVKIPPTRYPMILVSDPDNTTGYPDAMLGDDLMSFFCFIIDDPAEILFHYKPHKYPKIFEHKNDGTTEGVLFRDEDDEDASNVNESNMDYLSDRADWSDISRISTEIQTRVNQLYAMGVNEVIIRQIVALPEPKLSTLVITEDFRIILPDYNSKEISIPALSKALFFLFLRHEEGLLFKELRDYRNELYDIYCLISSREDSERIKRSIEDIVDSTKNSVNEKCSRIKAAFASQFQDKLACHYYITGRAGEPKRITLDRSLVEDKSGLILKR